MPLRFLVLKNMYLSILHRDLSALASFAPLELWDGGGR